MFYLLFFAGALIEILGMTISVIGIGQLVSMNMIIIMMAIAFDIGKIVTVSSLQRNWYTLSWMMKGYGLIAIAVTMTITSFGAAGYLTTALQNGIASVEKLDTKIVFMVAEKTKLEARKKQIDDQIAAIPPDANTRFRNNIISKFENEQANITARINELDKEIPNLQLQKIETGGEASSIVALAKSFNVDTNTAIKYLVFIIIFVFDPFAIYLIMSGNHVMMRSNVKQAVVSNDVVEKDTEGEVIIPDPIVEQTVETPEVIESEIPALTPTEFRSTLEEVEAPADLFENDINLPSRVISTYANGPQPLHVKVRK